MTGSTLSVSIAAALPGKVAAPSLLAPNVVGEGGPGVPGLAAFLDLMIGQQAVAARDDEPAEERQDDAAPGNSLPDKDDDQGDPALAWLLAAMPIALPPTADTPPTVVPTGNAPAATSATLPMTGPQMAIAPPVVAGAPAQPIPVPADPAAAPPQTIASQTTAPQVPAPQEAVPQAIAAVARPPQAVSTIDPGADIKSNVQSTAKVEIPSRADSQAAPTAQPIRIAVPQALPATLAAAMTGNAPMPALFALAGTPARDDRSDRYATPLSAITGASLLTPTDAAALIAKPGEAQRQALDMGRQDWPQKMIDRIEALRDDANANDTSIRLKPEALGRVDVSLRTHADGAISVHFTAEQSTTRSLIADAQPQLQAAAEARGIRLSGTSVDLGGSGMANGERPRPSFDLQQNTSNHLAASSDEEAVSDDGRIA